MIKKVILGLLMCLLVLNIGVIEVFADGMILPETFSTDYLVVRFHHVEVSIEDNIAVTRVEQEFFNPNDFSVGGKYVFPIPPDAVLSNFHITLDGLNQIITQQNREVTNTLLFNMVANRQEASLLQFFDWESYAFDLSIPAGGSRRMTLQYQELLSPIGGMYHYRYILSTEQYTSQPLKEVSIQVELNSSEGISTIYSSSHNVTINDQGDGHTQINWEAENIQPDEDFDLYFAPSEGGFGGGFLTGEREGIDHFLFLFAPDIAEVEEDLIPKDIVFIIDRSGSMGGEKIDQAQLALKYYLGHLNENDRFSVIGFSDKITMLSPTLQPITDQTIYNARNFVDLLSADGGTDIGSALQAGINIFNEARPNASRLIVFLTDGIPTSGVTDDSIITRRVAKANSELGARLHVFGLGYDVNTHLLDDLANENGGSVTYVQPGEDLEAVLLNFYGKISQPVLTDIEIEFDGLSVSDVFPLSIPDMFQGSNLMLTGRYRAAGQDLTVRVRGKIAGRDHVFDYHFGLDQKGNSDFVPRLWATRQIGSLLDQVRVEGESDELTEEIKTLGLSYGLVTPYTTAIIVAQEGGAASQANMALYNDLIALNQVSGFTTIQARVQNQYYQQANQASLAEGKNVVNIGNNSLVQMTNMSIDLALIPDNESQNTPITDEWLQDNISIDRSIKFGSEEYFELALDPEIRSYLQSGVNVIFEYEGEVISVQTTDETSIKNSNTQQPTLWESLLEAFFSWFRGR